MVKGPGFCPSAVDRPMDTATIAFTSIVMTGRPDLFPTAGIGTVFLLPAVLLLGRVMGYKPPHAQDKRVLSLGLLALFLVFAHDRIATHGCSTGTRILSHMGCSC